MPEGSGSHPAGAGAPAQVNEFDYLLAHFPGAVSIYDSDLVLLAANALNYTMAGLPQEGFGPGTPYAEIVRYLALNGSYGDVDVEAKVAERVAALRNVPWTFERKHGDRYVVGHAASTPDGRIICCQQDVTDQKQTELRLRHEIEERQAVERELLMANSALTDSQSAIRNLLDNADQGFLSIDRRLIVGEKFSAACTAILGEPPAGKPIVELLFGDAAVGAAARDMRATLDSLLVDDDEFSRELKIGLLPKAFEIAGKSVKVHYKHLADSGRLMLVMTDVTETMRLAKEVELERLRLEMIVLAVTEGETFRSLVEDYRRFLDEELPALAARLETSSVSGELYRRLHTYKGLLAQFHFHWSPKRLHEVETALGEIKTGSGDALAALDGAPLRAALDRDLASLTEVLGENFLSSRGQVVMSADGLEKAVGIARGLLAGELRRADARRLRELLELLLKFGRSDAKTMLALYARGVPALAAKLDKLIKPVEVAGDDVGVDLDRFGPFFRSLVHVFRNAVDHGVETPAQRLEAGKPEQAELACIVRDLGVGMEIEIRDDGRGIDAEPLRARLAAFGMEPARAATLSIEELVFFEGLTSRDAATETSGRGVGLAAIKHELEKLGGSVRVASELGAGSSFTFQIPYEADAASADADPTRKVA
jgi:two-component system chemotaxis sensor kinase CheA